MEAQPSMPTSFNGINHLKLPVFSIQKTHDFYTKIFPFTPLPQYDHFTPDHELFAKMFQHEPSKLIVEVRYVPSQAAAQKGWDPITYGVGTRKDLEQWIDWFDLNGVKHSRILTGIKGWVVGCEDPDGRIVRLYVEDEEHEWTDHPDKDEYWLGTVEADPVT
jgi:catechol 2,3-dioxygenase-like lactoylglutathione lyase family enzyme